MSAASVTFESECDYLENNSIDNNFHRLESSGSNFNSSLSSHDNSSQKPLRKQNIDGTASNRSNSNAQSHIQPQKESKKGKNKTVSIIELGEEIDDLPYKRPSRRGKLGALLHSKNQINPSSLSRVNSKSRLNEITNNFEIIMKESDRNFIKENTPNLLASRRIIDSFNIGDSDGIKGVIANSITFDCDVYISPINHHLKGRLALLDVWESMLEVFPDGVFRVSDTTINDKGELITRFHFSGARQFNFILGLEGGDVEVGEITSENGGSFGDSSNYSSDSSLNHSSSYDTDLSQTNNSRIRQIDKFRSTTSSPSTHNGDAANIRVDYSCPLIRSVDLLVEDSPVEVYDGVMVMYTNESYQICRLDYHWKRKS